VDERGVPGERVEPGAQRGPHALGPAVLDHGRDVLGYERRHLVRRGAEHDDERRAAPVAQDPQGTAHQRLAVQLDERLGPPEPPARARGEQQPRDRRQRLITVCGCS
jgi:hypothetical protein